MIGHDMGQAIKNRLTSIFSRGDSLGCLQHVSERVSINIRFKTHS